MPVALPAVLDRIDARIEPLILRAQGGRLDVPAHVLSSLADRGKLWIGIAGIRALTEGRVGRIAAVRVITVVGVQSLVVETGLKRVFARRRPVDTAVPLRFRARRPPSTSFPSGHATSAACASILLSEGTSYGPGLAGLAAAVAWSRVQTGLHHATDAVAGVVIGAALGAAMRRLIPLPDRR